ncbi:hypothetical protein G6F46_015574 [Rhizopus delemar]|nr:hypothetical protein G6F46_015574 [Rhizopus delemar]
MLAGMPICACACSTSVTASPSETPGARLNDRFTAGSMPLWLIDSGPLPGGCTCATADNGTICPVSGERRWK